MALEQKDTILAELTEALASVDTQAVEQLEGMIAADSGEIFCHGLGRSGLCSRGFAMRLMHLGFQCGIVGDVLAHPIHKDDLLIMTTASGTGASMEAAGRKAKALGARLALVTSNAHCDLASMADLVVVIKAPTKQEQGEGRASVMPMGSLFEETAFMLFDLITVDLMVKLSIGNDDMFARHANLE